MRLYFRDLSYLALLSFHQKLLARTLFSRLHALANFRENKVLANKKCFTVNLHVGHSQHGAFGKRGGQ